MIGRRVVVTGIGLVTPLGLTVADNWSAVVEGRSGIRTIPEFIEAGLNTTFAGRIQGLDPEQYIDKQSQRRLDPFVLYGWVAAQAAFQDAGLTDFIFDPARIGVAMGSGIGGVHHIVQQHHNLMSGGPRKVSPFFVPGSIVNMVAGFVSLQLNLQGPNIALATACATGNHNIAVAAQLVATGATDVMVAGSAEYASTTLAMAGFGNAKALSTRNDS
ncbi:MAG: beta-ketoacyl synthase N-terminal-like domain-containing protein, partial [Pseudomonadota bacterium]